ncbi:MAG: pseudouridine synthase [Flavobacteriales bacterium]|nr:pseudouridine synthase [Flavobacteriales bacterium]
MTERSKNPRGRGQDKRTSEPKRSSERSEKGQGGERSEGSDERKPRGESDDDRWKKRSGVGRPGKRTASGSGKRGASAGRGEEGPERPSARAGKRPPAAGRSRTGEAPGSRGGGRSPSKTSDGERSERPAPKKFSKERSRATRDARTAGRGLGRGQNRNSKRGRIAEEGNDDGLIRLNRYLAQSGVASRREADDLIKAGVVQVNGVIVTELGTKVSPTDRVHYGGQRLTTEKKRYVLLNKPKNFITTTDDPQDRRTVMALIDDACTERLYPVGRLDRHTTGVLLMTNDGDLAKKLTHPSFGAEKIYSATLDHPMTKADLEQLVIGVELEDGPAVADEASFVQGKPKNEVGIKIHMGRNRVVRRMFEALGYEVLKLDRVMFAGLTKKDLPRSKWRHLSEKEVLFLRKRK